MGGGCVNLNEATLLSQVIPEDNLQLTANYQLTTSPAGFGGDRNQSFGPEQGVWAVRQTTTNTKNLEVIRTKSGWEIRDSPGGKGW